MNSVQAINILLKAPGPFLSTRDFGALAGLTPAHASQTLCRLERSQSVVRIKQGLWGIPHHARWSLYGATSHLTLPHPAAVSFLTALHLHGLIEQIPQVIYVASTAHTRRLRTSIATYSIHQIDPSFFKGYDWHKKTGDFLIATPEKALADCFYLATRKGNHFGYLPEIDWRRGLKKKTLSWLQTISFPKIRVAAIRRLDGL